MATRPRAIDPPFSSPRALRFRSVVITVMARFWGRIAIAAVVAALTGATIAIIMPRGPVTTADALILMATGTATGMAAAFIMRSRWSMLVAPVSHLAVFELVRIGETGPTVDRVSLDTMFGILALLVGRGVYVLVGLVPMAVGAAWGASAVRWRKRGAARPSVRLRDLPRHIGGGLSTAGVVLLAIRMAMPASVPAVTGPSGEPIGNSVAELASVTINGNEQWLEFRGASANLPVLLYLSGGPGQSDLAFSRVLLDDLTQDFIVVGYDQRGNGKSYADWNGKSITLDQAIADTIAVTDYLRDRYDQEKIYVLGESWGTTLAVLAAQQAPERYYALINSGQMVSQRETDVRIYHDLLAWAQAHDDDDLARTLRSFGEPPYGSVFDYGFVLQQYSKLEGDYDPPAYYTDRAKEAGTGFWGMLGSEYTLIDKANIFRGLIDTFDVLYPQLQQLDFRRDVPSLEVPIYILDGEHEIAARRDLALEWFAMLDAPHKELVTFADGGHAVAFEHFRELHKLLVDKVLPATYPGV